MENKMKRLPNFTPPEGKLLLQLVEKFKTEIENPSNDSKSLAAKNDAWEKLTIEFNSNALGEVIRPRINLYNRYDHYKKCLRKKLAAKKDDTLTGCSSAPPPSFSPAEKPLVATVGLSNSTDSDKPKITLNTQNDITDHEENVTQSLNSSRDISCLKDLQRRKSAHLDEYKRKYISAKDQYFIFSIELAKEENERAKSKWNLEVQHAEELHKINKEVASMNLLKAKLEVELLHQKLNKGKTFLDPLL